MASNRQQYELHGIAMTEEAFEQLISVESPYRYELIDGIVYDMTGSSPEHSVIASNIEGLLLDQLGRSGPCHSHREQYVAIPGKPAAVPDVVLTCDLADWDRDKRLKPFRFDLPFSSSKCFHRVPKGMTGQKNLPVIYSALLSRSICWFIRTSSLSRYTGVRRAGDRNTFHPVT